jgi:hypothetical protein
LATAGEMSRTLEGPRPGWTARSKMLFIWQGIKDIFTGCTFGGLVWSANSSTRGEIEARSHGATFVL